MGLSYRILENKIEWNYDTKDDNKILMFRP